MVKWVMQLVITIITILVAGSRTRAECPAPHMWAYDVGEDDSITFTCFDECITIFNKETGIWNTTLYPDKRVSWLVPTSSYSDPNHEILSGESWYNIVVSPDGYSLNITSVNTSVNNGKYLCV